MVYTPFMDVTTAWTGGVTFDYVKYKYKVINNADQSIMLFSKSLPQGVITEVGYIPPGEKNLSSFSTAPTPGVLYDLTTSQQTLRILREEQNTAPTQPGAFTQPTGELEIGDIRTFSWGASTDAEGGNIEYNPEYKINNGNWMNVNTTWNMNNTSTAMLIPTANTLQFRVKARDSAGSESPYRESPIYTVTKPKYYWSKYNVVETRADTAPWVRTGTRSSFFLESLGRGYFFVPVSNAYRVNNSYQSSDAISVGSVGYEERGTGIRRFTITELKSTPTAGITQWGDIDEKIAGQNGYSYSAGSLIQSGIIAVEGTYPTDGKHTDGFWYVRGSRVNQSIAPTGAFSVPTAGTKFKPNQTVTVTFASTTAANLSLYEVDYRYKNGVWTTLGNTNALSRTFTTTTDKTLTDVQFRVRAKNTSNVYSDYVYSEIFPIEHNVAPLLTLNTENNRTLYENDTFIIEGSAIDNDDNQTLTIYYQIDSLPAKVIAPGLSKTTIPFNKQLVFKSGKLFEGETAITEGLADGQAHTLKVWATDNENSSSVIAERSFHVVPNRAPVLAVNPINQASGMINSDEITVSGTASDPDGNSFVVSYKINGGLNTEIYRGKDSEWSFQLNVKSLKDGENKIVIEVVDTYNSKFSKTITLNKSFITTPIKQSTAFYEITLPKGAASGVLLWIQRENGLGLTAEISMTLAGEQEKFVPMTLETSEMLTDYIMEDEFIYETEAAKDKAILKLNLSRESLDTSFGVTLLSGVLS